MYARHFGLTQPPFSIAPDPRYLFMSERHREALAHLLYGVRGGGGGFVVLTGDIGAGKTTVCRCLLEQLPARCNVAYIFNPKLTVEELLKSICAEFRIPTHHVGPGVATVKDYVDALNEYLLRTHAVQQNNVLIIDEAQNLSADVLEQLRLLTNLETHERKLLQIVLIGQPELRTMLAKPTMQQLAQRVIARYHLGALTESETAQYVQHRLAVAGLTKDTPFDARALRRVHRHARGVPRRINLLCDRALLGAYAKGKSNVDKATLEKAAREVFDTPDQAATRRAAYERPALIGVGLALGALIVGGLTYGLQVSQREPRVEVAAAAPAASESAAASASAPAPAPPPPPEIKPFDLPTGFATRVGRGAGRRRPLPGRAEGPAALLSQQRRHAGDHPPARPSGRADFARRRQPRRACRADRPRRRQRHLAHRRRAAQRAAGGAGRLLARRVRHAVAGATRVPRHHHRQPLRA